MAEIAPEIRTEPHADLYGIGFTLAGIYSENRALAMGMLLLSGGVAKIDDLWGEMKDAGCADHSVYDAARLGLLFESTSEAVIDHDALSRHKVAVLTEDIGIRSASLAGTVLDLTRATPIFVQSLTSKFRAHGDKTKMMAPGTSVRYELGRSVVSANGCGIDSRKLIPELEEKTGMGESGIRKHIRALEVAQLIGSRKSNGRGLSYHLSGEYGDLLESFIKQVEAHTEMADPSTSGTVDFEKLLKLNDASSNSIFAHLFKKGIVSSNRSFNPALLHHLRAMREFLASHPEGSLVDTNDLAGSIGQTREIFHVTMRNLMTLFPELLPVRKVPRKVKNSVNEWEVVMPRIFTN